MNDLEMYREQLALCDDKIIDALVVPVQTGSVHIHREKFYHLLSLPDVPRPGQSSP